jgi:hypothetical protein
MKLILENWRKFVENQQPITLDESQLLPEILKFDLNEELLNEVDTDPEAMSVDEIRKIPSEEIISIYNQMIPKQTKADLAGARASKRSQMSGELQKTKAQLGKYQKTGFFDKVVNSIKIIMNDIFNTDYEAFDKKSVEEKKEELNTKVNNNILQDFTPLEREVIRSIALFTGGNVPTVRAPKAFDEKKVGVLEFVNKSVTTWFSPTRETYEKANIILSKLQQKEIEDSPELFRGLELSTQDGEHVPITAYQVGRPINIGTFISFSTNPHVSWDRFSGVTSPTKDKISTMFVVPAGMLRRGVSVDDFSAHRGEKEIISSGDFRITSIGAASDRDMNDWKNNQFNSFEDLYNNFEYEGITFKEFYEHIGYSNDAELARAKSKAWWFFAEKMKVVIEMEQL